MNPVTECRNANGKMAGLAIAEYRRTSDDPKREALFAARRRRFFVGMRRARGSR